MPFLVLHEVSINERSLFSRFDQTDNPVAPRASVLYCEQHGMPDIAHKIRSIAVASDPEELLV